jgi:ribosomal protein S12 methylthiotransferase accessory factor
MTGQAQAVAEPTADWITEIEPLVSRLGLVNRVSRLYGSHGFPEVKRYSANIGSGMPGEHREVHGRHGAGRSLGDPRLARAVAIAEAAERYSASEAFDGEFPSAPMVSPPGRTIDLSVLPRCAPFEYAYPDCPVSPVDGQAEIRWTKGVELCSRREVWLPAIMASYRLPRWPGEMFWYPISTGYAVHSSMTSALFAALAEVVERDSIAITWLQKLSLPRVPGTLLTADTAGLMERAREHFLDIRLFDATTDIGLPTVYALVRAPFDPTVMNSVSCATGLTLSSAAAKTILDAISVRDVLVSVTASPDESRSRSSLLTGSAAAMAHPDRRHAFDFLTGSRTQTGEDVPFAADEESGLARLIKVLRDRGLEAVAVDRTTRELAAVGLVGVAVTIPALQPMSLHPRAQFRANPRLFAAPARMGYPVLPMAELNEHPQPFT